MKTIREKVEEQIALMDIIREKANINIVNCGHCGSVFLHERIPMEKEDLLLDCPYCPRVMDECDCPDFLYEGMQNSAEFDEPETTPQDETSEHYQIESNNFPENRISWLETHFQVVNFITLEIEKVNNKPSAVKNIHSESGHNGLMQLSVEWTKEFENKFQGMKWGESEEDLDYYDTIDAFLIEKNKI